MTGTYHFSEWQDGRLFQDTIPADQAAGLTVGETTTPTSGWRVLSITHGEEITLVGTMAGTVRQYRYEAPR